MLWALIMAGGSGTRFWPESRSRKPKQFLRIFGDKTLLQQTSERIDSVIPRARQIIITNAVFTRDVRSQLKLPLSQIVGEPVGRNTAPCAVLAAAMAYAEDPDAVITILPSDHRIGKPEAFRKALQTAGRAAHESGMPVTFGIKPAFAHTGYGYLERDKEWKNSVYKLKCFHEKPSESKARAFLKNGRFYWNSGVFVWRADSLLQTAKLYLPKAYELTMKIIAANALSGKEKKTEGGFEKRLNQFYSAMPNISIDYGLMEKLSGKILMLPVDIDWHDLGGWLAFEQLWQKDGDGNRSKGDTLFVESSGNIVKSGKKMIALLGVNNFVVVDTPDALLICPKSESESVRKIVQALKDKGLQRYL